MALEGFCLRDVDAVLSVRWYCLKGDMKQLLIALDAAV